MTEENLAKLLMSEGLINERQFRRAQRRALIRGSSLITQLDALGFLPQERVCSTLSAALDMDLVDITAADIPADARELVPLSLALKWLMVPVSKDGHTYLLCANPLDESLFDDFEQVLDSGRACLAVAPERQIIRLFEKVYGIRFPRRTGVYEDLLRGEDLGATLIWEDEDQSLQQAQRLVETMLEDANGVDGDVHILRGAVGYRACLCVGDELDELFHMPERIYTAVERYLRSMIASDADHGEFMVSVGPACEHVNFLLDIDDSEDGSQLFLSFLDRAPTTASPTKIRVTAELPLYVYETLQDAAEQREITISELLEHGWRMTQDEINTPCVCPYVEPTATQVMVELHLQRTTLEAMQAAARRNDRSVEWVLLKVYMMTRECLRASR